jgi:hypothetical protein
MGKINGGWRRDKGREEERRAGSDAALCLVNQSSNVMFTSIKQSNLEES